MSITLPAWYTGGYPDVEKLLTAWFQPMLTGVSVVSWLPKPSVYEEVLQTSEGFLRIYRTGGKINPGEKRDEARVQFAALTRSRDDSWELIEFVRQCLGAFGDGNGSTHVLAGTKIGVPGEVVGPQLIPELLQDDRLVPITVELWTSRPDGLDKYRQALGL